MQVRIYITPRYRVVIKMFICIKPNYGEIAR